MQLVGLSRQKSSSLSSPAHPRAKSGLRWSARGGATNARVLVGSSSSSLRSYSWEGEREGGRGGGREGREGGREGGRGEEGGREGSDGGRTGQDG